MMGYKNAFHRVYCCPALTVLRIFIVSMLALKSFLFYVYPLTSCGSFSEIMTDINKTQTLSYLQKMSLLRRPSHFIMNQKNQQVEKENVQNK